VKSLAEEEPPTKLVVRLLTSFWSDQRGIHSRQSLQWLRKKSSGFNFLQEDCSMIGADELFPRIVNLNESKDGIYQVVIVNEHRDYETGTIEDYDYKLIPLTIPQTPMI
jgi:hypothetical protein